MTEERLYDVHWEASCAITVAEPKRGHVLYQLTGAHCVYGTDALLYIGQTQRDDAGARLSEHARNWAAAEADQISVRLASVGVFESWEEWRADRRPHYDVPPDTGIVRAIEQLLIYVHQPSYNNWEKKQARGLADGHLRVFNTGRYRSLLPEISSRRYIDMKRTPED